LITWKRVYDRGQEDKKKRKSQDMLPQGEKAPWEDSSINVIFGKTKKKCLSQLRDSKKERGLPSPFTGKGGGKAEGGAVGRRWKQGSDATLDTDDAAEKMTILNCQGENRGLHCQIGYDN